MQAGLSLQALSKGRYEAGLGAGWLAAEVTGSGPPYPDPPARARRYREAVLIARELLREGRCRFEGEFYGIDVPVIGPLGDGVAAPPLVASLGGPWTIRHIAPLVDRVELKFGSTTRGGDLSMDALAAVTLGDAANVAAVRGGRPSGRSPRSPWERRRGGGCRPGGAELYGSFVGSRQHGEAPDGLAM